MTLKIDSNGLITIIGKSVRFDKITQIQAQSVLIKLGFEKDCLFECLWAFEEHGWNETILGLTGSFLYGSYEGTLQ